MIAAVQVRAQPPPIRAIAVHADDAPDHDQMRLRRRRWIAAMLPEAYDTGWLSEEVAENIVAIGRDAERGLVVLTLVTGTRIVDRKHPPSTARRVGGQAARR